ncbi:hypothetical protein EGW08_006902, partial [Elysia chlorotica]
MAALVIVSAAMTNMLAFYSLLRMMDAVLQWLGDRVGIDDLHFERACGYLLYPLSYMMGVHPDDCFSVGALIGVKLFATPANAFIQLGTMIQKHFFVHFPHVSLSFRTVQERSEVISTYAICGFSAFTALAIGVGGFFAVAPNRKKDIMKVIHYAFFAGNMACFATGAVAGK